MVAVGEIGLVDGSVVFGPGTDGLDGASACRAHATHLETFVEGYRIAARALRILVGGPLTEKELATKALAVGRQMFVGGEIDRREAVSRPMLDGALAAFVDAGYVKKTDEGISLTDAYRDEAKVRDIERGISLYQIRKGRSYA